MNDSIDARQVQHLIVPLDESANSQRALPIAIRLADRIGATVELLAVADDPARTGPLADHVAVVAREAGHPVAAWSVVDCSNVPHELARQVRATPGSLIVMSTHGPSRTSGLLTGSVATEVLAEGLPILTVGPHAIARAADLPIIACIDGSTDSEAAIPVAGMWARMLRVPLTLLSVDRPRLDLPPVSSPESDDSFEANRVQAAAEVAAAWPDIEVRHHVATYPWNVADAMELYLERHPAQLLVVAAHSRNGLARLLHPTTTGQLVRHLAAPVLVVPIPVDGASSPAPASATTRLPSEHRPFGEIIVPISPKRPTLDTAVVTANNLAAAGDAKVVLLTCVEDLHSAREHEAARSELMGLLHPTDVRWNIVRSPDVAGAVIAQAASTQDSIVCLATHAPGPIVDTLMPTTTGRLVRWSPRTVVLVGPRCAATTIPFQEIVACVDGSLISEFVADLAGSWAAGFGVPAHILHVADSETAIAGAPSIAARYANRLAKRVARHHQVDARSTVLTAQIPAGAIRKWAEAHPASILVMASHGEGASERPLGGTVMDVVRHAPTPVAVVPAHVISDHGHHGRTSPLAHRREERRAEVRSLATAQQK